MRAPRTVLAAGTAAGLLALAGCSAGSGGSPGTSSSSSTAPVTVTTTATPSSSAPTSSTAGAARSSSAPTSDHCTNSQVAISAQRMGSAAGHGGYLLAFRNVSSRTCTLHGYPGVDALRPAKPPVHAVRKVQGYMGGSRIGIPTVQLRSGHSASAVLEYANTSSGAGGQACPTAPQIAATAPNTTRSVVLQVAVSLCSLQIHPTVAGTSGDAG